MMCTGLRNSLLTLGIYFQGLALAATPATQSPMRIISTSLAGDEILLTMLASCGGFNRIVALSSLVDDPTASNVTQIAKQIKGRAHSEPEAILNKKPDLVIAATFNRPEVLKLLRQQKINLMVLEGFASADDIARHILEIGERTNCAPQAKLMHSAFYAKMNTVSASTAPPQKKTRVINYSPDLTLMGKDTLFDDLVTRAGATNLTSEKGIRLWPKVDAETLLSFQPEKIIIIGEDSPSTRREVSNHPVWKRLTAVQSDNLLFLNPRYALSTSHYFADAVTQLREKLSTGSSAAK